MSVPPVPVIRFFRASWAAIARQPGRILAYGWPVLLLGVVRMAAYPSYAFLQVDPVGAAPLGFWLLQLAESLVWAALLVELTRYALDDTYRLGPQVWLQRLALYWARAVVLSAVGICGGLVAVWLGMAVVRIVAPPEAIVNAAMLAAAGLGVVIMVAVATRWGLALPGTAICAERRSFAAAYDDMRFHMVRATTAGVLVLLPGLLLLALALTLMAQLGPGLGAWAWGLIAGVGRVLMLAALAGLHAELYSHLSGTGEPPEPPDLDELDGNLRSLQRKS